MPCSDKLKPFFLININAVVPQAIVSCTPPISHNNTHICVYEVSQGTCMEQLPVGCTPKRKQELKQVYESFWKLVKMFYLKVLTENKTRSHQTLINKHQTEYCSI